MNNARYTDANWFEPMPDRVVREKSIEKGINSYAKKKGVLFRKFVTPGRRGAPDRLYIAPGGQVGFLEVKRPGKEPTPNQFYELSLLEEQGAYAGWANTLEMGKNFIDGLLLL